MRKKSILLFTIILTLHLASAVIIESIDTSTFQPGREGQIRIEIENVLNDDAEDVTLSLDFSNIPFIPVGTSTQSVKELDEDDDETFVFTIRASNDITPGNYAIPYTLSYTIAGDSEEISRTGTIGITLSADPDLAFSITSENAVIDKQGKITLKIINKGFSNARFLSVRAIPEGFTILSDKEDYIGEIESDDFETISFDVHFKKKDARFQAIVEYIDFNNKKIIKNIDLPINVYTQEEAIELGIIQPSRTSSYIITLVLIIILIIIWRWYKKKQRLKRSARLNNGR